MNIAEKTNGGKETKNKNVRSILGLDGETLGLGPHLPEGVASHHNRGEKNNTHNSTIVELKPRTQKQQLQSQLLACVPYPQCLVVVVGDGQPLGLQPPGANVALEHGSGAPARGPRTGAVNGVSGATDGQGVTDGLDRLEDLLQVSLVGVESLARASAIHAHVGLGRQIRHHHQQRTVAKIEGVHQHQRQQQHQHRRPTPPP